MNVELLLQIKERILQEPDNFGMWNWVGHRSDGSFCETAACLAGWAVLLDGGMNSRGHLINYLVSGMRALELPTPQANRLFYLMSWPKEFQDPYRNSNDLRVCAKIAAKRIDHFIATNGAE